MDSLPLPDSISNKPKEDLYEKYKKEHSLRGFTQHYSFFEPSWVTGRMRMIKARKCVMIGS
jgi:hypothetical protein